jgi:predicted transcriptional regulator
MNRENFKRKLKSIGISQKEFAALTGCAYSTVKNWENIPKWADVLLVYMEACQGLRDIGGALNACMKIEEEMKI